MTEPDVLTVIDGTEKGMTIALTGDGIRLGRDPEQVNAVLTDGRVSRVHARVWDDRGVLMLEDLGSSTGTLLNGGSIDRPMPLRRGDVITLGSTQIRVDWVPAPAATMVGPVPDVLRDHAAPGDGLWPERGAHVDEPAAESDSESDGSPTPAPAAVTTGQGWPTPSAGDSASDAHPAADEPGVVQAAWPPPPLPAGDAAQAQHDTTAEEGGGDVPAAPTAGDHSSDEAPPQHEPTVSSAGEAGGDHASPSQDSSPEIADGSSPTGDQPSPEPEPEPEPESESGGVQAAWPPPPLPSSPPAPAPDPVASEPGDEGEAAHHDGSPKQPDADDASEAGGAIAGAVSLTKDGDAPSAESAAEPSPHDTGVPEPAQQADGAAAVPPSSVTGGGTNWADLPPIQPWAPPADPAPASPGGWAPPGSPEPVSAQSPSDGPATSPEPTPAAADATQALPGGWGPPGAAPPAAADATQAVPGGWGPPGSAPPPAVDPAQFAPPPGSGYPPPPARPTVDGVSPTDVDGVTPPPAWPQPAPPSAPAKSSRRGWFRLKK